PAPRRWPTTWGASSATSRSPPGRPGRPTASASSPGATRGWWRDCRRPCWPCSPGGWASGGAWPRPAPSDTAPGWRAPSAARRAAGLGALEGTVQLWHADLVLNQSSNDTRRALQEVRRALAKGLPPAEDAYARGLLADNTDEARKHFEEAARADPHNPRVSAM